jgi:hypothetical protein
MSTICKLNPKIREARAERKSFSRFLQNASDLTTDIGRIVVNTLERVDKIRKDSAGTADSKRVRFERALQFYATERRKLEPPKPKAKKPRKSRAAASQPAP